MARLSRLWRFFRWSEHDHFLPPFISSPINEHNHLCWRDPRLFNNKSSSAIRLEQFNRLIVIWWVATGQFRSSSGRDHPQLDWEDFYERGRFRWVDSNKLPLRELMGISNTDLNKWITSISACLALVTIMKQLACAGQTLAGSHRFIVIVIV